ncbi:MAG: hypothetical protein GY851_17845, partial [bacterium]|nr:hypothetical protein [bacterium]
GPGPDLVIFGSGANEKTDTPDEVAVFEGTIRWIQRHYGHTEFLVCQFQNAGAYTPNRGDMQALSLRYGIPFLDYGLASDDVTRWCNRYALVPADGHPQAAAHYLWFKQAEKAFECSDPMVPGQPQEYLPERAHANTYGWEGEMVTYDAKSGRLNGGMFMLDDTAMNCWGAADETPVPFVDGEELALRRSAPTRDIRNSLFRHGRCRLGDRHVLELVGPNARLTYVDAKVCPGRRFFGADHPRWQLGDLVTGAFSSQWGAPCGTAQVMLEPGKAMTIDAVCSDISVAYADAPDGGVLRVVVDDVERLVQPTNEPFVNQSGVQHFMENRKGVLGLGYGWHTITLEAKDAPVRVLGLFTYDARPNRLAERRIVGRADAGETIRFTAPFRARPFVVCTGDISVTPIQVTPSEVTFGGSGSGTYQVIGE